MAKQIGILPLKGTITNITFLKTRHGFIAKYKSEISKQRIQTDPSFQRTRENISEFTRAGTAADLLKLAFDPVLINVPDHVMFSRVFTALLRVVKSDQVNLRGERTVTDGRLTLLRDFEFSEKGRLSHSLRLTPHANINRVTGDLSVTIGQFIPNRNMRAPRGTEFFKLVAHGAAIDFRGNTFTAQSAETGYLPWDGNSPGDIELTCNVGANSTMPLFLALGVQFYEQVGSNYSQITSEEHNALKILTVSV